MFGQQGKEGDPTYLRQLLGAGDYKLPDNADMARYMSGLKGVYTEFEYLAPPNDLLNGYFRNHRGADKGTIDLTSSATNLPPYEPAMRAASSAAEAKDNEINGRFKSLLLETEKVGQKGAALEDLQRQLSVLTPRNLDDVGTENLLDVLTSVLADMKPEAVRLVRQAHEIQGVSNPVVNDCIEHCSDRDYAPRMPRDRTEIRAIKQSALDFIRMACDEELEGKYTKTEGLKAQFTRLKREVAEEKKRLPTDEQLSQQGETINEKSLKPAVIRMMQHLQGIEPSDVKPQNLCLCKGSSTHIMDAALKTLVPSPSKRFFGGAQKKKVLLFSMSWDGLKTFTSDPAMEPSLIDGSVNAQALDEHIQKHILKGRFPNEPEKAKAEVRKQVGALVMNIPENPLGKIPSDAEMQALAGVIEKYDLPVVVVDEIFAAPGHRSLLTYPHMGEHCYIISSTSKNINTGNKLAFGYSINDDFAHRVSEALESEKQAHPVSSTAFSVMLEETPRSYYEGNQEQYARKRRLVSETMETVNRDLGLNNGLRWMEEPNYGCLGVVSLPRELTDSCGIENSCQLAEYIFKLSGVQTMPIGDVNQNHSRSLGVRINFSEDDHMLTQGIERIGVAVQHMQQKKQYKEIQGDNYRGRSNRGDAMGMLGAIAELFSGLLEREGRGGRYDS